MRPYRTPSIFSCAILAAALTIALLSACGDGQDNEDPCDGINCPGDTICVDGECQPEPCLEDDDCPPESSICDEGSCRRCLADQECSEDEVCEDGLCRESLTSLCAGDADCEISDRPYCNERTGACVECRDDWHCYGIYEYCDTSAGRCLAPIHCYSNEDCFDKSAPLCDPVSGVCRECLQDSDCDLEAGQSCDSATQRCLNAITCTEDADCLFSLVGYFCDRTTSSCVECISDSDCIIGTGRKCEENKCSGSFFCSTDSDCADLSLSRCDLRLAHCVECLASSDCEAPGSTCNLSSRSCRSPVQCATNADCEETQTPICNEGTGHCVECTSTNDCSSSIAACIGGVCDEGPPADGRPGSPCTSTSECISPSGQGEYCWGEWQDDWKWYQGYCSSFCDRDNDCPDGSSCLGGMCWDSCTDDSQCRRAYSCQTLSDGIKQKRLCAPECDPDIASKLECLNDFDCEMGVCNTGRGKCECSPIGGRCHSFGYCMPGSSCIPATSNDQDTGFIGGYCIVMDCGTAGGPSCPPGSTCFSLGEVSACLADCDPNKVDGCPRPGYGCNDSSRFVVAGSCRNDSDCPSTAPDCLQHTEHAGACVRICNSDNDCDRSVGHICSKISDDLNLCVDPFHRGACLPGCTEESHCLGCTNNTDCPSDDLCVGGACLKPCYSNDQCNDKDCFDGYCRTPCRNEVDCLRGSDCVQGYCEDIVYLCDRVTQRCDPSCEEDSDCGRTRVCDRDSGLCITPCDSDNLNCGPTGRCNAEDLLCEMDCSLFADLCPEDLVCEPVSGQCQVPCGPFGEGECDEPLVCDIVTGKCMVRCAELDRPCTFETIRDDCEEGEICNQGYCAKKCEREEECPPGLGCDWGICSPCAWPRWRCDAEGAGLCLECYSPPHCGANRYCDIGGK